MTFSKVVPFYPVYYDADGAPLENGYIYIGTENLNPEVNAISVFWDEALTIPAEQPVRTLNGYPSRSGSAAALFVSETSYSVIVRDSTGVLVHSELSITNEAALLRDDLASSDTTKGAELVAYKSSLAGAVARTCDDIFDQAVRAEDFGVVADGGVSDQTSEIAAAINAADGRIVYMPRGHIRITAAINTLVTAGEIRIIGAAPVGIEHKHLVITGSSTFAIDTTVRDTWAKSHTLIECDGCNFIGETDTVSTYKGETKLKLLKEIVVFGVNGAEIGLHIQPTNCTVEECFFARFEMFGILTRRGITSVFHRLGFDSNGWNLAESGSISVYPTTYGSGCNIKINANDSPQAYHTLVSAERPTTFYFRDIWIINSDYYLKQRRTYGGAGFSGQRAIQAHGLISGSFENIGAYTGLYFNVCQVNLLGFHIENYSEDGIDSGDFQPRCFVIKDSRLNLLTTYSANFTTSWSAGYGGGGETYPLGAEVQGDGYLHVVTTAGTGGTAEPSWNTTVGGTTNDNTVVWTNQGATSYTHNNEYVISGYLPNGVLNAYGEIREGEITDYAKILTNNMIRASEPATTITSTATGGGTSTTTVSNVLEKDPLTHDYKGFHGIVAISLTKQEDFASNAHALFHASALWAAAALHEFATRLNENATVTGVWDVEITDCYFETDGDLVISVTWGTSWNSDFFNVDVSLFGGAQTSSH